MADIFEEAVTVTVPEIWLLSTSFAAYAPKRIDEMHNMSKIILETYSIFLMTRSLFKILYKCHTNTS